MNIVNKKKNELLWWEIELDESYFWASKVILKDEDELDEK